MLDPTINSAQTARLAAPARQQAVFRMITSDRMAGSIPAWIPADSAKDKSLAALSQTNEAKTGEFQNELSGAHSTAMAYAPQTEKTTQAGDDAPFGFGDLVDIVNPLQHIPIVSTLYRAVTGDKIRASSEIVGGAIYGGVAGAAGSLANVVLKKETGRNAGEHALALVTGGHGSNTMTGKGSSSQTVASAVKAETSETPVAITSIDRDNPIERLAAAQASPATPVSQLPGNMLSFVDLGGPREQGNRPVKPLPAQPQRYAAMYRLNA